MPRGKSKNKTAHDRKVARLATQYEKAGYTVEASTGRRPSPQPIGHSRKIPDIVATSRGSTKIIEVETPISLKTDKGQLEAFARYAARKRNVSFDIVMTRPRKTSTSTSKSPTSKVSKKK